MMYAWHWTHIDFFWKQVALSQWSFMYKLSLFKEVLCFDVLECESASSGLSKLDAVWMNGRTGHFYGWLPRFSMLIIYPYVFWSVYPDVTMHYAKCCWRRKRECEWFQLALNRSFACFHWLTRLPACLPPRWPGVRAKWTRCWIPPPAVAKCLVCVSSASLWQTSVKSVQVVPPF